MISAPNDIWGVNFFDQFAQELGLAQTAKLLEVTPRTIQRWRDGTTPVPRMAVLALFWETKYGRGLIDTSQVNEIRMLYMRVRILERQYQKAKDVVAGLRKLHTGTANEPYFEELDALYPYEAIVPNQWGDKPLSAAG